MQLKKCGFEILINPDYKIGLTPVPMGYKFGSKAEYMLICDAVMTCFALVHREKPISSSSIASFIFIATKNIQEHYGVFVKLDVSSNCQSVLLDQIYINELIFVFRNESTVFRNVS